MDHMPLPYHATQPRLEVPIYAPEMEYDRGLFLGYLKRIGWTSNDIIDRKNSAKPHQAVYIVLQTWTYFGMLFEVTEIHVPIGDLSTLKNERAVLQMQPLTRGLDICISQQLTKPVGILDQEAAHFSECLCIMASVYDTVNTRDRESLHPEFHLPVQLLYECLARATTLMGAIASVPIQHRDPLEPLKFCRKGMEQLNWCPSDVHMLSDVLSMTEIMFASMLNRPGPARITQSAAPGSAWHTRSVTRRITKQSTRAMAAPASSSMLHRIKLRKCYWEVHPRFRSSVPWILYVAKMGDFMSKYSSPSCPGDPHVTWRYPTSGSMAWGCSYVSV